MAGGTARASQTSVVAGRTGLDPGVEVAVVAETVGAGAGEYPLKGGGAGDAGRGIGAGGATVVAGLAHRSRPVVVVRVVAGTGISADGSVPGGGTGGAVGGRARTRQTTVVALGATGRAYLVVATNAGTGRPRKRPEPGGQTCETVGG